VPSLLGLPPPVGPTPLTTEEVSRLANLAGVPDANRHNFSDLIVHELTELHIRQRKEGPRSDALKKAVASLRSARQALQDMTQEEMRYFAFADANDPHIQLGIAIDTFLHIADGGALTVFGLSPMPFPSRRGGSKRPRGRPLGTRINPALESIVCAMTIAAFNAGGDFSIDEKSEGGTLADALKVLAPHFPRGIVPNVPPLKTLRRAKKEVVERLKWTLQMDYTFHKEREEWQTARTVEECRAIEKKHEKVRARLTGQDGRKRK
jgi:hypothetical protein